MVPTEQQQNREGAWGKAHGTVKPQGIMVHAQWAQIECHGLSNYWKKPCISPLPPVAADPYLPSSFAVTPTCLLSSADIAQLSRQQSFSAAASGSSGAAAAAAAATASRGRSPPATASSAATAIAQEEASGGGVVGRSRRRAAAAAVAAVTAAAAAAAVTDDDDDFDGSDDEETQSAVVGGKEEEDGETESDGKGGCRDAKGLGGALRGGGGAGQQQQQQGEVGGGGRKGWRDKIPEVLPAPPGGWEAYINRDAMNR